MASALNIGKIVNMHGLKGEVKVYPYTNDMKRFEEVGVVYTDKACTKALKIQGVKYQKSMVIVKFEGYDHINAVEHFKQVDLYIDRDTQGIDLDDEEFYIADLIGVMVVDQDGKSHGIIKDVLQLKAQDVLEIEENGTKWFLPFVDPFIIEVDLQKNTVIVSLIEGIKDAH
jgi:16S rRNA processing protein RimM